MEQGRVEEVEATADDIRPAVAGSFHAYLTDALPEIDGLKTPPSESIQYLEDATYRLFMISYLLGMVHAAEQAGVDMAEFSPEPLPMEEAVDDLKSRVQLPASEFYQMDAAVRFRAFTVSRITGMDAVTRVKEKLDSVLEEGRTLQGFIESGQSDAILKKAGFSENSPWYWETVYRTNTISAWNAGRWTQMRRIEESIRYVEFVAIEDARTTAFCRSYSGVVRKMDDPIWGVITPPNHFNCRSTTRAIMKGSSEAEQTAVTSDDTVADLPAPQSGFEASPLSPQGFAQIPPALWERAREYGIENEIYEAADRAGVSLGKAADDVPPPVSVPLNVKTRQDMVDVIKERLGPVTRNGIERVDFKSFRAIMSTNSMGGISVSTRPAYLASGTFTPSKELLSAFKKLGKKDLTFNEEYALESLWHEINHNRQIWGKRVPKWDIRNVMMETTNQWVSRRTYPEMLDRLGGFKPKWQKEIIESGYGYEDWVRRMDNLVGRLGLTDQDVIEDIKQLHLETDRVNYMEPLADILAEKSGKSAGPIRAVLRSIMSEEKFERELRYVR